MAVATTTTTTVADANVFGFAYANAIAMADANVQAMPLFDSDKVGPCMSGKLHHSRFANKAITINHLANHLTKHVAIH